MSEAERTPVEMPPRIFETRQPFDLSDELKARVEALDLNDAVEHVKENGYGYIHNSVTPEFVQQVRDAIIRLSKNDGLLGGRGTNMLLAKDPVFEEVVLNPQMLAIAEVLCGQGALLSQVAGSIKTKAEEPGDGKGGLHADQNWTPAPFPVHNQLVTFCWALDDYNAETGSTTIIPKSHFERRHPNEQEVAEEPGAIATECPAGSIVFWDGATWHSGGAPRRVDGERVVLHVTYGRLALRPVESYDFLDEDWLKDRPYEMRVILGREDFLNTPQGGFAHGEKLSRTMDWAKN